MKWFDGVNKLCRKVSYFKVRAAQSRFGTRLKIPRPVRADRLKMFTLNQKDGLSVAEWPGFSLKGLIGTINKYCYYQERQKRMQHSQVLIICTSFPALLSALFKAWYLYCYEIVSRLHSSVKMYDIQNEFVIVIYIAG